MAGQFRNPRHRAALSTVRSETIQGDNDFNDPLLLNQQVSRPNRC